MRLGDFDLVDSDDERRRLVEELNRTERDFPAEFGVGELFARQAAATPDAEAVVEGRRRWTYAELEHDVDRLAAYMRARGVGPEVGVGVLLRRSYRLVVALLATMRAGGVYVPLNPELPLVRLRSLLLDTGAPVVVFERGTLAQANALQWEAGSVAVALCIDSDDVGAELERPGPRMDRALWDHVAERAGDSIEAGGWRSAHTGELLSERTMASYVDGIVSAVAPALGPDASVLEIGCGSGLTMAALAPLAGRYVGIDISPQTLRWARRTCERRGLENVSLHPLEALHVDRLPEADAGPFDAAVLASVVQSFPGLNHLRSVLRSTVERVAAGGVVYVGHVWDVDRREELLAVDRQLDGLFVARGFFEDLPQELPRVGAVEIRPMACDEPEIAAYAYDVLLRVADAPAAPRAGERRKRLEDRRALPAGSAVTPPVPRGDPGAAAYVIQTSGSTGQPRSVEVEMRSLVNLLWWYRDACPIEQHSRVAQVIPSSFDASIKNYLAPLVTGATLVLLPDGPYDPAALLALIDREAVTVLNPGVPAMVYPLAELAAAGGFEELRSLRCLALGGEAPELGRLRAWLESPGCAARVLNVYGPTECTDIACWYEATAADVASREPLPIGLPVHNAQAYVLGQRLEPEPVGVVGELCISGIGLARGYRANPEATAERFPPHPFRPGERIYRTGDLARRLPDGRILLHGRADSQLKVRGHRIEAEEVEAAMRAVPGVEEAAVAMRGSGGSERLVGYVCASGPLDERAVRDALRRTLPAAVVPEQVVALDSWPRTAHGKLDRRALPAPGRTRPSAEQLPRSPLERSLAELWRDLLGLDGAVGTGESFFDVGGHSLAAAGLVSRVRELLELELSVTDVYNAQTIGAQAALLGERRGAAGGPLHVLAERAGPALFCMPPIAAFAWTFAELARRIDGLSVLAFDFPATADPAIACADAIEAALTAGEPCLLAGYSAGGLLAAVVAGELERRAVAVGGLVLFDAAPPALRESYTRAGARAMAEEVVADPRLAAHVEQAGRDRVRAAVTAYATWYDGAQLGAPLSVDVLAVSADGADPAWAEGWRGVTHGELSVARGRGTHDELLSGENAAANAAVASAWLHARVADHGPTTRSSPLPERSSSRSPSAPSHR